jgi:hypothetical protein
MTLLTLSPPNDTAYVAGIVASGKYAIIAARDMGALATALDARGYDYLLCDGVWNGEHEQSYLVQGMSDDAAIGCGIAFSQDCVIVNGKMVECKVPHTITYFDGHATLYGEDARTCEGYTECHGYAWSLVAQSARNTESNADIGVRVAKSGHGAIYAARVGEQVQYTFRFPDGSEYEDVGYDVCDRLLRTGE